MSKHTAGTTIVSRLRTVIVAVALLMPASIAAQQFPTNEDLTTMLRYHVEDQGIPGMVMGVLEPDGSTRIVSYGSAGPDTKPLGPQTLFEIGSITKLFTATILADMVAKGEVALDDPISKYLPDGVTAPTRGGYEITLLDLSTHHSGLPRLPDNMDPADSTNPYTDYTVERLYAFLASHELRRDIGLEFEYSNLGMGLLGHVLGLAAGRSFPDLVQERILDPLDMTATTFAHDSEWLSKGHNQDGGVVPYWTISTSPIAGAGGLQSNAEDMLKFLKANVGDPTNDLERAMRSAQVLQRQIDDDAGIGLNWTVRTRGDVKILGHGGGTAGFHTRLGFDPSNGAGFIVLANGAYSDDIGPDMLVYGRIQHAEVEVPADVLESYMGQYRFGENAMTVGRDGDALTVQLGGNVRFRMYPTSTTEFYVKRTVWQFQFDDPASGDVGGVTMRMGGQSRRLEKVDPNATVAEPAERVEIEVDEEILQTYVGEYQLSEAFSIVVTLESGQLFGQATGQNKLPLFAESETEFFLKAVDAQVTFTKGDSGDVTGLILHQNGRDAPAEKVR